MNPRTLSALSSCALALLVATSLPAADESPVLARFSVDAGKFARVDTPVSVALPVEVDAWGPLRLTETTGGQRVAVPAQVEPGKVSRVWWVVSGTMKPGAKRQYELSRGVPAVAIAGGSTPSAKRPSPAGVHLELSPLHLDVSIDGALLFRYNHSHVVPPEKVNPAYIRSGYIHPMYGPRGDLLTEDFPSDHHHHKGIWMPWTGAEFRGAELDFWNLGKRQGTVQFAGYRGIENGPIYGRILVGHQHVDLRGGEPRRTVLDETWDVRVWSGAGPTTDHRVWDITSTQTCVTDSPLHLKAYRYGGLGWRGPKSWNGPGYQILTSEGKTRRDSHATHSRWCAHSGDVDGQRTTVVVLCHPSNERYPEPMRTWNNGMVFFNYVPPQKQPMDLAPWEPNVFRYRFYIHDGGIDAERAEAAWAEFAEPPTVTIERTS